MALIQRLKQLKRFTRPSAWRFLALVATDPRWQPLYDSLDRTSPMARFETPVPWLTWHSLAVLTEEVGARRGSAVLEWGMGGSTLWFHQNGLRVTAIEHDPIWYEQCRSKLGDQASLHLIQDASAYSRPDLDPSEFSIFVIDGRLRNECARFVAEHVVSGRIAPGSLIVFDNSERDIYREGLDSLSDVCGRHRSYSGPTAPDIDHLTTIFWV